MYHVSFTVEEFQAFTDMLECHISELHTEIVHTDRRDLKALLKSRKQVLVKMLENAQSLQNAIQGA